MHFVLHHCHDMLWYLLVLSPGAGQCSNRCAAAARPVVYQWHVKTNRLLTCAKILIGLYEA